MAKATTSKSVMLSVRVPTDLHARIAARCGADNAPVGATVIRLIQAGLDPAAILLSHEIHADLTASLEALVKARDAEIASLKTAMATAKAVRVENPMLCAQFTDWILRQGAPLPWNFGAIIGEIVDAEDRVVFHVDVSYSREKAGQISAAILTAVNTCGGYKVS